MNLMTFDVSKYVLSMISGRKFSGYGPIAQVELAEILKADGFSVAVEVPVQTHNRVGRIDLVAVRNEIVIGFEIDSWSTPKSKSVEKLAQLGTLTHRVLLLNHDRRLFGKTVYLPAAVKHLAGEIDFMAHLDVYFCGDAEKKQLLSNASSKLAEYHHSIQSITGSPETSEIE